MKADMRPWLMYPQAVERYRRSADSGGGRADGLPYAITEGGVALLSIVGPIQKYSDLFMDLFGGVSSENARAAVVQARNDPNVDALFLRIDSPGGEVAGTEELAQAIYETRGVKPIAAHIEDLGASAAYWAASQADRITANSTAEVGSIGTIAMFPDVSQAYEAEGIKWHVVSSGEFKGEPSAYTGVTEKSLGYVQEMVNGLTERFVATIRRGRSFTGEQIAELTSGKVYLAARAVDLGLIDGVMSRDRAYAMLARDGAAARRARAERARGGKVRRAQTLGRAYANVRALRPRDE